MTTRKITGSQLRGMIREALEESVVEIQLDEQIAALRAKGGRRSLQETKRYRKLLEMKMEMIDETEQLQLPGIPTKEEETAVKLKGALKFLVGRIAPGTALGDKLEDAAMLPINQRAEFLAGIAKALSIDTPAELAKVITAIKLDIKEVEAEARKLQSGEAERQTVTESRRRLIRRR